MALIVLILPACEDKSSEPQDPSTSSKQLQPNQPEQGASADLPGPEVILKTVFEPGKRYVVKQVQKASSNATVSFGDETHTSETSARFEMLVSLDFLEGEGSVRKATARYDDIDGSMQIPSVGGAETIEFVSDKGKHPIVKPQLDALLALELELAFDQDGKLLKSSAPAPDRPQVPFGNGINTGPGSEMVEQLVRSFTEGFPEESIKPGHRWKHTQKLPTLNHGEIRLQCDYSYDGMESAPNGTTKLAKVSFTAELGESTKPGSGSIISNMTSKIDTFDCSGVMYFDLKKESVVYTATDVKLRAVNYVGENEIGSASSEIALVNELVSYGVERPPKKQVSPPTAHELSVAALERLGGSYHVGVVQLVSTTEVTNPDLAHLKGLIYISMLRVHSANIGDEGMVHLRHLNSLRYLILAGTHVTDAGIEHFNELNRLEALDLSRTKLTDAGLRHLSGLKNLKELDLRDTECSAAGVKELQVALPECHIKH